MSAIEDIPELVGLYREGDASREFLFGALIDVLGEHEIPAVLRVLPDDLASGFVEALRESFDNDVPDDGFISFSSATGAAPIPSNTVKKVRSWLVKCVSGQAGCP